MFKSAKFIEWRNAVPSGFPESKPFGVSIPVQRTWQHAKRKCLLVFEHVDTEDLRSGRLLTGPSGTWIKSAIDLGMNYAKHHSPQAPAYAAVNFNFFKTFDLRPEQQIQAATAAAKRIKALAKKLGATDIIVFGDTAASFLMTGSIVKDDNTLLLRRGRPMLHEGIYWTNTISLSLAYQGKSFQSQDDDEDEKESKIDHANLLGYVSRCVGNALIRRHVYKIDVKPRVVTIKTYKGFIRLYRKLMAAPRVSVDAETNSLARVVVKLLTLQFAFDPTKSYLLAIDHKDATWTPEEKKKVVRGLRKFFGREFDPLSTNYDEYLIGQNLKFDLTILRQRLGLYMIQWRVWDLMAGEFSLDENMKALVKCRTPTSGKVGAYSLAWMCAWYNCDFYATNPFSKDQRATIETRSLDEPGLTEYCGMDAQTAFAIHDAQIERAAATLVAHKSYKDRYKKFIVAQMSNLVQIESVMEHRGDQLDIPYLMKLKDRNGPITVLKKEIANEFKNFPEVRKANAILAKRAGIPTKGLFGGTPWIFGHSKPAHKQLLFIDVMGLAPVALGKSGAPKIDKEFQALYKDKPPVAVFTQLAQIGTLESTYVSGFFKKFKTDIDMRTDGRMRPSYGFTGTVTGRSNSYDPNLQNIPQRGKFAKFIKRMFVAPRGCLILKMDYSAHEVRVWGIVAGDDLLCSLFINGRWLRQQYRKTGKQVYKTLMDTKGDIHKVNCEVFFKVEAKDVTAEQRNSVKSIVFGAIYGRGPKAIAAQAGAPVETIKEVLKAFFERFKKASDWLDYAKGHAVKNGHMYSPIWRMRNMFTQMYGIQNLVAATERRGCNAPIQGFAADIGHTAATLYQHHIEKVVKMFDLDTKAIPRAGVNTFVHDAIKTDAPYEYLLACLQVLQWCATTGVMEYYKVHWGVKFHVEVEVEFEFAAHDDAHWKYDWHDGNGQTLDKGKVVGGGLQFCIRKALEDQKEVYSDLDIDAIEKQVWAMRKNKPLMTYLDKNYPFLADWPDAKHIDVNSKSFKTGLGRLVKETEREEALAA